MKPESLALACGAFAAHHKDPTAVPFHHFRLLLEVAMHKGGCTYRHLEEALNLDNGSVSRTVTALGAWHRTGRPGLGLLTTSRDPEEHRRLIVSLTPKGAALLRHIESL
jgi:DNA-binding MarR family transcriptional regulator